ncbi:hypothetical protein C8Q80DRAFT_1115737 [Daedaleopsis nitida]|nr:hypothetical protein C8Q80DRAFT_1115737 [Daedaleopsis nitida]
MFATSALNLLVLHALSSLSNAIPAAAPEDVRRTDPAPPIFPLISLCEAPDCQGCADVVLFAPAGSDPQCFLAFPPFASARVYDPDGALAPGAVEVSPGNCTEWLELPLDSVCYNMDGDVAEYTQWGFNNID